MLDMCVLAVLNRGDSYGWQVIKDLGDVMEVSESTLYPVLRRLEAGNSVRTYEEPHNGRLRKYFHITNIGKQRLRDFQSEYGAIEKIYRFILDSIREGK